VNNFLFYFRSYIKVSYILSGWPLAYVLPRLFFTSLALSVLFAVVAAVRKNLVPATRSWLWTCCIPALFLPYEYFAVFVAQKLNAYPIGYGSATDIVKSVYAILAYLWFAGFLFCLLRTTVNNRRTIRLIKARKVSACAAYFYKFRSRIYLPPDFYASYASGEREMLLAHEQQHIAQHDPLLFRLLQLMQCVFWFCPPIHMAVRFIRHDRELLCDERVTRNYSKREYGLLLIREAEKALSGDRMTAGIAQEPDGVFERVKACAVPFSAKRKTAAAAAAIAAVLVAAGLVGTANPIKNDTEFWICLDGYREFPHIAGAERFVTLSAKGIEIDEIGLYEFLTAQGFELEQTLSVTAQITFWPAFGAHSAVTTGDNFIIETLRTEEIFIPHGSISWIWNILR
jgi:beta-lactamase regulating signal transducer with metallopeptidase domain